MCAGGGSLFNIHYSYNYSNSNFQKDPHKHYIIKTHGSEARGQEITKHLVGESL